MDESLSIVYSDPISAPTALGSSVFHALEEELGRPLTTVERAVFDAGFARIQPDASGHAPQRSWTWVIGDSEERESMRLQAALLPLSGVAGKPRRFLLLLADASSPGAAGDDGGDLAERLEVARQLAVTLNHEVNNPLFVASATLEDLLADCTDEAVTARMQLALDSIWRVAEAVKQLQELRKVVSTTYIPGFTMIDLQASSQRPEESA